MRLRFIVLAALLLATLSVQAVSNKIIRADMSFFDFEELTQLFNKGHKQVVHIMNHDDSPVVITKAEVSDTGTVFFKDLTGAQNTYKAKVKNKSGRKVLAYELTWVLKHPFEDYVFHKIHVNSINPLGVGDSQVLKFRRSKHYRDDAYYYVEVSKVEYDDDESIWEAPELGEGQLDQLDQVKQEIDAMEDDLDLTNGDNLNIETLKEQLDLLESSEELNPEKTEDTEIPEVK